MALVDNLIAYWPLDEASGDALDAHGSNDLTDNNTVGAASGKVNGARDFEFANSEYFARADNADLSTGDIDWTFACWVNAESLVETWNVIVRKGTEWHLYYVAGPNTFRFYVDGSSNFVASSGSLSTATWAFVVVWHDSVNNQIGISVNAGAADTNAHTTGMIDGLGPFELGGDSSQSFYWDGLIDEVGFWKRVLTSDERTELYNAGSGRDYAYVSGAGGGAGGRLVGGKLVGRGNLIGGRIVA